MSLKLVNKEYRHDICIELMKKLGECHELLRQLPSCVGRTVVYDHIEEAHAFVQLLKSNLTETEVFDHSLTK